MGWLAIGITLLGGCGLGQPSALPDLDGKTLAQVGDVLGGIGLHFEARGLDGTGYCSDDDQCFVTATTPTAGTVVKWGGTVKVTFLTAGERSFYSTYEKMPKVVGWPESKVDKVFGPVSSVVSGQPKETPKVKVGRAVVIGQSPKAGTRLKVGQQIRLTIGFNTGTSSDPDLGGVRKPKFCSARWWC